MKRGNKEEEEKTILEGKKGLRKKAKKIKKEEETYVTEKIVGTYVKVTVETLTAEPLDVTVPLISEVSSCDIAHG